MFKNLLVTFLILTAILPPEAMASKVQQQGIVTAADCTTRGIANGVCLPLTDQIYDSTNGQQLSASISGGLLGGGGGGAAIELLSNTGFESGLTGYTASGGTTTTVTSGSNLIAGAKSASWTATGSGQTFSSAAMVIKGLAGGQCSAQLYYLYAGTANDYKFQVVDGSANVLASTNLGVQSLANTPVILTFPCGGATTSTLTWQVKSNVASPSALIMDTLHLGSLTVQQASQAQEWGALTFSCSTTSPSVSAATSFTSFSGGSGCTNTSISGQASAPASQNGAIKFASMPAGTYYLFYAGRLSNQVNGQEAGIRWTDGTNNSREVVNAGNTLTEFPSFMESIVYTSAQSNVTLQLQALTGGSGAVALSATVAVQSITVLYVPSTTTSTVNVGQQPQSWSGFTAGGASWSTTSASFVDPTVSGTPTLTPRVNNNFGTVSQSGTNPALTFTPTTAATYFVCSRVQLAETTTGDAAVAQLVDGNGTVIATTQKFAENTTGFSQPVPACGLYTATSTSAVVLKFQLQSAGGGTASITTGSASNPIEWSIVNLSAALGAAQFNGPGSVTSGSTNAVRFESASIAGTGTTTWQGATICNSGTCATFNASTPSWISFAFDGTTGNYTGTITSGIFSGIPNCTCSWSGAGADNYCEVDSAGRTITPTFVHVHGAANGSFTISCSGPH